jgi:hypothetical protein
MTNSLLSADFQKRRRFLKSRHYPNFLTDFKAFENPIQNGIQVYCMTASIMKKFAYKVGLFMSVYFSRTVYLAFL